MMTRAERRELTRKWVLEDRPDARFMSLRQVRRRWPEAARHFESWMARRRLMTSDAVFYEDTEGISVSVVGEGKPPADLFG